MRREAFDGERPGHAHLLFVFIRLVVEVFEFSLGGDGRVDFLLPRDARSATIRRGVALRLRRPLHVGVARDLPFLPLLLQCHIERLAQRLESLLKILPDDVDFGIVGDGLERDMGNALVDEPLADVTVSRCARRCCARNFRFLILAVAESASR